MEVVRCIKCGRPLRDPESIVRGMGPECAGASGGHPRKYRTRARSHGKPYYAAMHDANAATPTLLGLIEKDEQPAEQEVVEYASPLGRELAEILKKYPTDLIDLVLSAPAPGAIAWQVKNYSKKKKPQGSMPPGKTLQEIRRMCIDLRLAFFPGISTPHGQQIACVPYGDEGWRFENSEKVLSRHQLESYLARYGMIRLASR